MSEFDSSFVLSDPFSIEKFVYGLHQSQLHHIFLQTELLVGVQRIRDL